jgi:hypothetical protein
MKDPDLFNLRLSNARMRLKAIDTLIGQHLRSAGEINTGDVDFAIEVAQDVRALVLKLELRTPPLKFSPKFRFANDAASDSLTEAITHADELGGENRESLARSLATLERLAGEGYVEVYYDTSEYSVCWTAYPREDPTIVGMHGGLIYHADYGEDANGCRSVRLETGSWSVHT